MCEQWLLLASKNPASNTFPIFERFYPILANKISELLPGINTGYSNKFSAVITPGTSQDVIVI